MFFKDEENFSFFPKCLFMASILLVTGLTWYLSFKSVNQLPSFLKPYAIDGDLSRRMVMMSFLIIYVSRLMITVFVFLKRKMVWSEMVIVSCLMSFALFSFVRAGGSSHLPIGGMDYFSIALFLLGSWLNTYAEYTRYVWKKQDKNKGHLYTEGLFKTAMHINYFGDIVLFAGFALATLRFSMLFIPFAMALNFIFVIIPRLDKYLADKYGEEFQRYAGKTKKFVPWIY